MTAAEPADHPRHRAQSLLRSLDRGRSRCRRSAALRRSTSCRPSSAPSPSTTPRSTAVAAQAEAPTFDNTIERAGAQRQAARPRLRRVLQSGGRPHQRRAAARSSARSGRSSPPTTTASCRTRRLFQRIDALYRARDASSLDRRAAARAGALPHHVPACRRRPRRRHQEAARRDHRAAGDARHDLQPERAGRRAGLHAGARERGGPRRPAGLRARGGARGRRRARHGRQARHHAVAVERRAVPAVLRPPRPAREGVPRLDRARRRAAARPTTRRSSPRRWRCAPSAPSCSATRPLRTTGSTTPWRRRRRPCATCSSGSGRRRAPARSPTATPCRSWCGRRAATFTIAPWDWRYYAEKLRKVRCDIDEATVKPYFQLHHIIEAAFYTAYKLFGLTFERRKDVDGLASRRDGLGGARAGRPPPRAVLRRLLRAPVQAQRRLDDDAARPGEADRRHPPAGRQRHELQQGRRRRSRRCSRSTTRARCSTSSAMRCTGCSRTSPIRWSPAPACSPTGSSCRRSSTSTGWSSPRSCAASRSTTRTGRAIPDDLLKRLLDARNFNQGFATVEYVASALVDLDVHLLKDAEGLRRRRASRTRRSPASACRPRS